MNLYGTVVGRLGADPERIGSTGARFRLSSADRVKNDQGAWEDRDQTWTTVKVWGKNADYVLSTLKKGQEVIVVGTLFEENWTDKDGNKRNSVELRADHVGATVFTMARSNMTSANVNPSSVTAEDPWAKVNA